MVDMKTKMSLSIFAIESYGYYNKNVRYENKISSACLIYKKI